jgi:hypothetical protein
MHEYQTKCNAGEFTPIQRRGYGIIGDGETYTGTKPLLQDDTIQAQRKRKTWLRSFHNIVQAPVV